MSEHKTYARCWLHLDDEPAPALFAQIIGLLAQEGPQGHGDVLDLFSGFDTQDAVWWVPAAQTERALSELVKGGYVLCNRGRLSLVKSLAEWRRLRPEMRPLVAGVLFNERWDALEMDVWLRLSEPERNIVCWAIYGAEVPKLYAPRDREKRKELSYAY